MSEPQHVSRVDRSLTVVAKGRGDGGRLDPQTIKKHRAGQREWRQFCRLRGYPTGENPATPTTPEYLAEYVESLAQRGYAESTIRGRLAAVKALCRERGAVVPDDVAAWFVLRGVEDTSGDTGEVNIPVARRAAVAAIAQHLDVTGAQGARDLCLVTMAHAFLLGETQLAELDLAHVQVSADAVTVRLPHGSFAVEHGHPPSPPELVCAACAALRWLGTLAAAGATSGPLFRSIDRAGNIGGCGAKMGTTGNDEGRLNRRGIQRIWTRLCIAAGLPRTTPRALVWGGAADLLAELVPLEQVMARGGWSFDTPSVVRRLLGLAQLDAAEVAA